MFDGVIKFGISNKLDQIELNDDGLFIYGFSPYVHYNGHPISMI